MERRRSRSGVLAVVPLTFVPVVSLRLQGQGGGLRGGVVVKPEVVPFRTMPVEGSR